MFDQEEEDLDVKDDKKRLIFNPTMKLGLGFALLHLIKDPDNLVEDNLNDDKVYELNRPKMQKEEKKKNKLAFFINLSIQTFAPDLLTNGSNSFSDTRLNSFTKKQKCL